MNLPAFSVKKRVTTLMLFCGAILLGVFTMAQLPLDLYPEMDIPVITVTTSYEGASPEEVEQRVTRPLEQTFATIEDVRHIVSTSSEGVSQISINFQWGADLDARASDVRDAVDNVQRLLPEDVERSQLVKFDLSRLPVLIFGVLATDSYENLESILENLVVQPLETIPGVAAVASYVPLTRQVNVDLDRERLASYGLTPLDVAAAIGREDQEISAGSIKSGYLDYLPRVPMRFRNVRDLDAIMLTSRDGNIVRLTDVASVTDGFREVRNHISINNRPGGIMMVVKQADANTVTVAAQVKRRLAELSRNLPADVSVLEVRDNSEDISFLIRDLLRTLLLGGGLAVLTVLVFLRRIRATAIIAMSIPFALLISGVAMYALSYSINTMTLFALIICIGLVLDNSIVVLENITRHREEGETPDEGAIYGAAEVGLAISASTLTTVCIFLPLFFVEGMTRIFFQPFAIIASLVLLASLLSALTITPMFSAWFMSGRFDRGTDNRFYRATESAFHKLSGGYGTLLGFALRHRGAVLLAATALFVASGALVPFIGFEFTPKEDRAFISGNVTLPVGTRLEATSRLIDELNRIMEEVVPGESVKATYTQAGRQQGGGRPGARSDTNVVDFGLSLVLKEERDWSVYELAERIRARIEAIGGIYSIEEYTVGTADPMAGLFGGGRPLTINIQGDDIVAADRAAETIRDKIIEVPGTVDVSVSSEKAAPELWVQVDRERASALGLRVADINQAVRAGIYGTTASRFREGSDEYDIFVRLREADRADPESLGRLPLRLPGGRLVRLDNVAEVAFAHGPKMIERRDQQRIIKVEGDIVGRSAGEVIRDVRSALAGLEVPAGLTVAVAGQADEIGESYFWLSLALLLAVVLVYMVMASQFESLLHPFVVLFSIPFAFTGVIWGLFLSGTNLSIIVFLGLLMLIGVVVNNAIVLVDYTNILRERGLSMAEAIREAGRVRLRPVLMTALTTIIALVPMAFRGGQGSETWNPLGITIVSGLLVGTLVTLVIVPVIYSLFEGRREKSAGTGAPPRCTGTGNGTEGNGGTSRSER